MDRILLCSRLGRRQRAAMGATMNDDRQHEGDDEGDDALIEQAWVVVRLGGDDRQLVAAPTLDEALRLASVQRGELVEIQWQNAFDAAEARTAARIGGFWIRWRT